MRQLLFTVVIWGLTCSLVSATEEQDSIYELGTIELPAPPALVTPLVAVSEPENTEQKQNHLTNGHILLSQTNIAPFLPSDPSSISEDEDRLLREFFGHIAEEKALEAMTEKPKQKTRGILFTGGALLLSKLAEITVEQIRQAEDYRLLNLYHGYRQR